MPFGAIIPLIAGVGGALFGASRKKSSNNSSSTSTSSLDAQQQQLIDIQKRLADYGIPAGQANFEKAGAAYDTSLDFYKKILGGSNNDLMSLFNADEYTKSADESEATAYNLAGRSGSRAATLAGVNESRMGNLFKMISQLRSSAPSEIANIGQAIANMGAQQLSAGSGGLASASNSIFGLQQLRNQEADRRASLISSIIGTAGSVAGAAIAFSDENLKENIKPISNIREKLREVHGVSFDWNLRALALGQDINKNQAGILANQVYKVFPDLVEIDKSGYKKVNYTALTALLTDELNVIDKENNLLKAMTSFNRGENSHA